jgi:hypothetical protein
MWARFIWRVILNIAMINRAQQKAEDFHEVILEACDCIGTEMKRPRKYKYELLIPFLSRMFM